MPPEHESASGTPVWTYPNPDDSALIPAHEQSSYQSPGRRYRQEYVDTTEKVYDIAAKHNAVIDAINKKTPIGNVQDEVQV